MNLKRIAVIVAGTLLSVAAHAAAKLGDRAPDFTLTDLAGKPVKLSDFKGKHVVLEWTNPHCPYVAKHYDTGNMQGLQKAYAEKSVAWLTISSTNPSHREYASEAETGKWLADKKGVPTRTMLDKEGTVGRLYEARTTPHMFIVDPQGTLIFAGGIDDKRSWNPDDVKTAKNYVRAALDESLAGKAVSIAAAAPYG